MPHDRETRPRRAPETARRRQLIDATLAEIGTTGTLSVTVGQIARRAGVSPALAFHYFGDKEALFLAAMRSLLRAYRRVILSALAPARGHRARLEAVLTASVAPQTFADGAVAAWLNFYVLAQTSPEAQRLLRLYQRRLESTLLADLRPLLGPHAPDAATRLGALVDGLYLRLALIPDAPGPDAGALMRAALARELGGAAGTD